MKISGPLSNVDYSGDISMTGLGFKFIFTGVDYNFADAVIPVSKGLVVLDGLKVNDGRANSSGTIAGAINFENLSSLGINLIIQADDLLLLNTSQKILILLGKSYCKRDHQHFRFIFKIKYRCQGCGSWR